MEDTNIAQYLNPTKPLQTFVHNTVKSFHKSYQGWLVSYRKKQDLWDLIKIVALLFGVFFFIIIFLIYINLASTGGYFLRRSTNQLDTSQAKADIIKLEVIKKNKQNRDNLVNPRTQALKESVETIYIPEETSPSSKIE